MTIPAQRRLSFEFTLLPNQFVISIKHNEIVNVCRRNEVLLSSGSGIDTPSTEKDDIRTTDIGTVAVTRERRSTRDTYSRPFVFLCIEDADIVKIAGLKLSPLSEICSLLSLLIKSVSSLNDHVGSDLDSSMPHSSSRNRPLTFRLRPCHHLQIQDKQIVEVFLAVSSTEDEYFCLIDKHSGMTISCRWRPDALRALKPCHGNWVQCMQISKNFALCASSSEDNDLRACKDSGVRVSGRWRRTRDLRFCEFVGIDIENVSIVQICVSLCLACIVVTAEDDDRCA